MTDVAPTKKKIRLLLISGFLVLPLLRNNTDLQKSRRYVKADSYVISKNSSSLPSPEPPENMEMVKKESSVDVVKDSSQPSPEPPNNISMVKEESSVHVISKNSSSLPSPEPPENMEMVKKESSVDVLKDSSQPSPEPPNNISMVKEESSVHVISKNSSSLPSPEPRENMEMVKNESSVDVLKDSSQPSPEPPNNISMVKEESSVHLISNSSQPSPEPPNNITMVKKESSVNGCWRHCPQRINKIYFKHWAAGLSDRLAMFDILGNLAGYLCAIVELPPPRVSLNHMHSGGKNVDSRVEWKDIINFTFAEDGSQVIYEAKDNPHFPKGFWRWEDKGIYEPEATKTGWTLLYKGNMLQDFRKAQDISWSQQSNASTPGFIWEIHQSLIGCRVMKTIPLPKPSSSLHQQFYKASMQPFMSYRELDPGSNRTELFPRRNVESCDYINIKKPDHSMNLEQELQDRVRSIALSNSVFGFFHIRRNDAKKECDTSIPKIRSYFQCSLNGTETTGKNITILLGSDEKDNNYRQEVIDMAKEYPHVSMLDADKIVVDFMQDLVESNRTAPWLMNNFFQFQLLQAIGLYRGGLQSVYMSQRRSFECPKCLRLIEKFAEVWV